MKTIQAQKHFQEYKEPKKKNSKFLSRLILLIITAVVFYVLFTYVLPSVAVTVFLEAEDFIKEYEIVLDQNIPLPDESELTFPAKIYSLQDQKEDSFKATGEKNIGDKAHGLASFYNSTGRSQPLTTKIELVHSSGKKYFLSQDLTVPAASLSELGEIVPGTAQAEVEAAEAGEGYNQMTGGRLNISVLSLELQSKIYLEAPEITGGSTEIVQVVSQEDLDKAQNALLTALEPELKDELRDRLKKSDEVLFNELTSLEIINLEKSIELDQESEDFKMKIMAELKALVFNGVELKKYLRAKSLIDVPNGKMVAEDDLGDLEIEVKEIDLETGSAVLNVKVNYKILPQTNLAELKQNIKGLNEQEARRFLMSQDNIRDVRFDFSMNLSSRVPENLNKIEIKVGN